MGEISIHIRIGQREYPMKVLEKEEQLLRETARQLNDRTQSYVRRFNLRDHYDILAMVAFDLMVSKVRGVEEEDKGSAALHAHIKRIGEHIGEAMDWAKEQVAPPQG